MKFLRYKDKKNRKFFLKTEKKSLLIKFLLTNLLNKYSLPVAGAFNKVLNFNKSLSIKGRTNIIRRCIITNRGRAVSRKLDSSRFILRNLMQFGVIPGFKKSVW